MVEIVRFHAGQRESARCLLESTDMFRADEVSIAMSVIDDYLFRGEDYQVFAALSMVGELFGYVCFGKRPLTLATYDIYWIVVASGFQGMGIGTKLFRFAWEEIQKQGGMLMVVETSSQPKYKKTSMFYEKQGCQLEAMVRGFYNVNDDLLIYTKRR